MPNQRRTREGLTRDNLLTVVHDLFVTDTALYADYVLPATSQIEHLDLSPRMGTPLSGAEPAGHRTAWRVRVEHGALPSAGPGAGPHGIVALRVRRIDARAALASGHAWLEGITYDDSGRKGTSAPQRTGRLATVRGGRLSDQVRKSRTVFESLLERGQDPLPSAGDIPARRGLQLISGKALHFLNSGYGHLEWHRRRAGELYVEIHEDDARPRGVDDSQMVRVSNALGSVLARCHVSPRVRPGVV